ncbi:nucleotide disphospho-sugar-binding domain-containing protein [Jannaschia donghaensis]|uniref:Glycosyltransferase, MGT family n=1 Tax=Jannaschia donghaensis TaxID=420998 RepID=A0A0M6YL31_9RHOB|nr:nucleotide disphospho-sugar-binding domain-containing protein [Jannaschia donghaensis]CTQ51071.1 glycosyltransferase, MGT family [Jannaschia donghaensis]
MLATAGSLGDLYPVLSTAISLEDLGLETRLLLSPDDCEIARSWGLLATPIGPTRAQICAVLGQTEDQIAESFFRNPLPFLRRVAIPAMADAMPEIELACVGASCVSGTFLAFGAAFAAEKAGLPYVPLLLQPMLTYSVLSPARGPGFDLMVRAPANAVTRRYNRTILGAMKGIMRLGLHGPLDRARADMGLPPFQGTSLVDAGGAYVPMRLGLWSDTFALVPKDAPPGLRAVGFARSPLGTLPDDVRSWLEAGPPPLVITLGSVAQNLGGTDFYDRAIAMARALGLRSVVLHGKAPAPNAADDVLARPGIPHGPLFEHAAAVLHHGGMGTSAEALRAGCPQFVMPIGGDQPDNAARLVGMGVAVTLPPKKFTEKRALPLMRALLDRFDYAAARDLADYITAEDGARAAAAQLAKVAAVRD